MCVRLLSARAVLPSWRGTEFAEPPEVNASKVVTAKGSAHQVQPITEKVDVWSFGCMVFESWALVSTGDVPCFAEEQRDRQELVRFRRRPSLVSIVFRANCICR